MNKEQLTTFFSILKEKIANNQLKESLSELLDFLQTSSLQRNAANDIILLQQRYTQLHKENNKGTLTLDQFDAKRVKIADDLLQHIDYIENQSTSTPQTSIDPRENSHKKDKKQDSWVNALANELKNKQRVAVNSENPMTVFQYYGWLIGEFLRKMKSKFKKKTELRQFSYMVETYQSSMRYLCYIQLAQLFEQRAIIHQYVSIQTFFKSNQEELKVFDFASFLLELTNILQKHNTPLFVPEIAPFTRYLADQNEKLYEVNQFLYIHRKKLLNNELKEEDLENVLDKYLTELVFWLKKLSFLAKYRLVSIKDIQLSYWAYQNKNKKFTHFYADLHEIYRDSYLKKEEQKEKAKDKKERIDYIERVIENASTYSQSVLLFKGRNLDSCFDKIGELPETQEQNQIYLSLSPLIIDYSAFLSKKTQTPEIYYFAGKEKEQYYFAKYGNELPVEDGFFSPQEANKSNKVVEVKENNVDTYKFDELFEQMDSIFSSTNAISL